MNFQPLIQSLTGVGSSLLAFLPRLVNGLIIFIAGYLISWLIRWLLRFIFRHTHLEQAFGRIGITRALQRLGIRLPLTEILVQAIFYFMLLSFTIEAVSLMGLTPVAVLLQEVLLFVPRAISAAILLLLGSLLARFLGDAVTAVADNVNIVYGRALGKIIEYTIVAFVVVLALATLGIETTILTTSFTIIVASAGIAVALTFALGTREVARNVIAGYYVRQQFRRGQRVTLGEYSGTLRSTTGAYTTLEITVEDGSRRLISLPNALLMHRVAISEEPAPPSGRDQDGQGGSAAGPSSQ
jgi:small-conductance mechanosensitive channel